MCLADCLPQPLLQRHSRRWRPWSRSSWRQQRPAGLSIIWVRGCHRRGEGSCSGAAAGRGQSMVNVSVAAVCSQHLCMPADSPTAALVLPPPFPPALPAVRALSCFSEAVALCDVAGPGWMQTTTGAAPQVPTRLLLPCAACCCLLLAAACCCLLPTPAALTALLSSQQCRWLDVAPSPLHPPTLLQAPPTPPAPRAASGPSSISSRRRAQSRCCTPRQPSASSSLLR